MHSTKNVLEVIGHLYDAATDMDKWPVFLEGLSEVFDASDTHLLHFDPQETRFTFSIGSGPGMRALEGNERHLEEAFADDPRVIAGNQYPGKPISCRTMISEDQWHASRTYRFLEELGAPVEYTLSVNLPEEDGTMTGLALMRYADGSAFTQQDCDLLGEIIPHIKRTLNLQKRLIYADFKHRVALQALDHLPTGMIITNGDGHIEYANESAREIAERGDGMFMTRNEIRVALQDESDEMRIAIHEAVQSAHDGKILPGKAMTVTRSGVAEPYPVMVSTLWGNHIRFGLGVLDEPMAVIFVTDPDRPQEALAELLQRLYGLTPTESRILERLVDGATLEGVANDLGITIGTVRQHMKPVFQKTDTHRQAELIKKVLASPVWMHLKPQKGEFLSLV